MVAEPVPPPTLAELRKAPHVSYSAIRAFLLCPMKFMFSYNLKAEPSHKPAALILGSAVHTALEAFYRHVQQTGERISEHELLAVFRDKMAYEWDQPIPVRWEDDDPDGGGLVDEGVSLLKMFHVQADLPQVLGVEVAFAVPLCDPVTGEQFNAPLIGAWDLLVQGPQRPVIVEHKTTSRKYTKEQLSYELQPSCYRYAALQAGVGEVALMYQLLIKGRNASLQHCRIQRTDAHVRELLSTFCEVIRCIDAGRFWRARSWACADCTYAYLCNEGM